MKLKGTLQPKKIRGRVYAYDCWYNPKTKQTKTDYLGPWEKVNQELTKTQRAGDPDPPAL